MTEIDEDLIPKFDTEEDKKKHLATLKCWEQKVYHSTLEDYAKHSRVICKDLASACGTLHGLCDTGLQSRLEAEPEYKVMEEKNRWDAMKLHKLVKKNCNGSL